MKGTYWTLRFLYCLWKKCLHTYYNKTKYIFFLTFIFMCLGVLLNAYLCVWRVLMPEECWILQNWSCGQMWAAVVQISRRVYNVLTVDPSISPAPWAVSDRGGVLISHLKQKLLFLFSGLVSLAILNLFLYLLGLFIWSLLKRHSTCWCKSCNRTIHFLVIKRRMRPWYCGLVS